MIKFDFETYMENKVTKENIIAYSNTIDRARNQFFHDNKMADWYNYNTVISPEQLEEIKQTANYIKSNCEVFVVIGIGGSYLGAKGVIEALTPYFKKNQPEILFAGTNLSGEYLSSLINYIENKEVIINVISKSGNTLEPSIAFNTIYRSLKNRYTDEELKNRIIITTDKEKGQLLELSKRMECKRFEFPTNIGGRFSTLTLVGMLPMLVAGIDISELIKGAMDARENTRAYYNYCAIRDIMYNQGKTVEIFNIYEPKLQGFIEWIKQIFAETQGKSKKALLPVLSTNTNDLHSLGQFFQEGKESFFETSIEVEKTNEIYIKKYSKYMDTINSIALKSVAEAHYQDGRPTSIISLDELTPYNMGYLVAFFEISSTIGAYILGVDYSNQPGVTKYKEVMHEKLNI